MKSITRADVERIVDAHMDDIIGDIQREMDIPNGDVAGLFFDGDEQHRKQREFLKMKLVALHIEYTLFEEFQSA